MEGNSDVWWRPRRAASPWLVLAGLALALIGVVANDWHGPSWALLVVALVVAGGGLGLETLSRAAVKADERIDTVGVASRALDEQGVFRSVSPTALEDFRVHSTKVDLPYVVRDRQQEVHDRLVDGLPVLILGHSLSGKTRMAVEVVRELYGEWPVWIPERPDGLARLMPDGTPEGVVVWLDDLETYLAASEPLRLAWLNDLRRHGCRIVATMRASEYAKFQPRGEVRAPQWEVIERFHRIRLEDSQEERMRIANSVGDSHSVDAVRRYASPNTQVVPTWLWIASITVKRPTLSASA